MKNEAEKTALTFIPEPQRVRQQLARNIRERKVLRGLLRVGTTNDKENASKLCDVR